MFEPGGELSFEPGGELPRDIRGFAERAGCPDARLPGGRRDRIVPGVLPEAGLESPATCFRGWCSTCTGPIVEGHVAMSEALRHYPEAAEEGSPLRPRAQPRPDLAVETHRKDEMREHRRAHDLPAPRG